MNPELLFLLGLLATWRLARDYVNEEGPLGLYGRSRRWLRGWAEKRIEASDVNDPRDHAWYWLYDGIDCLVCASFWSSFVVVLSSAVPTGQLFIWWLGLAGGALVVERIYKWLEVGHGSE